MAESIALAASVIAIIQLADRVISLTKYCLGSIQDCPSDIRAILVEISSLKAVLESLSFLLDGNSGPEPRLIQQLAGEDGPIEDCRRSIEALERLLPSDIRRARGKRQKVLTAAEHLAWPLRETSARKLMDNISCYKASIVFAVTYDSTRDIRDIQKNLRRVKETLTRAQRDEICNWLETTNPSSNHNNAWELHEPHTGLWMRRASEWQDWLSGKRKFLWVHGIPGAGKTILASFLVEECQAACNKGKALNAGQEKPVVCISYYCYFARNQDEAVPFLRWLAGQLCRQVELIPAELDQLFQLNHVPRLSQLLTAIQVLLEEFTAVSVIIDAVDESQPREDLLKIIRDLATDNRFDKIRLLATSREYYDIELCFSEISLPISMKNPAVEDDIRLYVHSAITSNRKFEKWPHDLTIEVEKALAKGAKGMFRWAVCQIDVLQRLTSQREVRDAILHLPKSLDETYERIFQLLSKEDTQLVRLALIFICGNNGLHPVPLQTDVLLQAILFRLERARGSSTGETLLCDLDTLREGCGCLISLSGSKGTQYASLAHYTVQEFLYSDRIAHGVVATFALSDILVQLTIWTTIYEVIIERHELSESDQPWLDPLQFFCILTYSMNPPADHWFAMQSKEVCALERKVNEISRSVVHLQATCNVLGAQRERLARWQSGG